MRRLFAIIGALLLAGCAGQTKEMAGISMYQEAFTASTHESPNDYVGVQVAYKLYSFGNAERLKAAWRATGRGEWPAGAGAMAVPGSVTGGMPEIWGLLHREQGGILSRGDKPNVIFLWHEDWHIRSDSAMTWLYPDSDNRNVPEGYIVWDPRDIKRKEN